MTGEEVLRDLLEGNRRYVAGQVQRPHQTCQRRDELIAGQHPQAVVLTCSDSRCPPEMLFDQGIGDLFVIRLAGNIVDDAVLGSIEYAAEHLHVPLVVVLGHSQCGAVTAAVTQGHAPGHIGRLIEAIRPAVERAKTQAGDVLDNAIRANVQMAARQIGASWPILAELTGAGKLLVVGAYYDLHTGEVSLTE